MVCNPSVMAVLMLGTSHRIPFWVIDAAP